MEILGPNGKPLVVDRKGLTRRDAPPTIFGVRNPWRQSQTRNLTPQRLAAIYNAVTVNGDMMGFADLAEEMEERDAHYRSVLSQRKLAITAREWQVTADSDHARDQKIAELIRAVLKNIPIHDLQDAIAKGYSLAEITWNNTHGLLLPMRYDYVDPRLVTFDRATGRTPYLLTNLPQQAQAGLVAGRASAAPLTPGKFIWHPYKSKSGLPGRGGLAHPVLFLYLLKHFSIRDWWAFMEVFGLPLRVGKYGPTATEEEIETLVQAVSNLGSDAGCVIPESMQIDFVSSTGSGGSSKSSGENLFMTAADWINREISKVVVGQTMSTEAGSSLSQSEVHERTRDLLYADDARQIAKTIQAQLVRLVVDLNFGTEVPTPTITLISPEREDPANVAELATKASNLGLPLSRQELYDRLKLRPPTDAADTLSPMRTQAVREEGKESNRTEKQSIAGLSLQSAGEESDWQRIAEEQEQSIAAALNAASGDSEEDMAEDFYRRSQENMGASTLAVSFAKGRFAARVEGEIDNAS